MTLCFDEAFDALKSDRISESEYVHQILAHFNGTRHPADAKATRSWESMIRDPVGNAIRDAALHVAVEAPSDCITVLHRLFLSILDDDVDAVRSTYADSARRLGTAIPIQAVATFAALHGETRVLRLCLEMGASLDDRNTAIALEYATRRPALLDVLYEHNWRDIRQSRLAFDRMAEWSLHTSADELNWFLDHGASFDQQTIRRAIRTAPVKAACVEALVQRSGTAILKGTGLLQSAAKRGHVELVRILLQAGLDVDEIVPQASCDDGEVELTALYEAVYKQHDQTVQLLLDFGADPSKKVCDGGLDTPLKLADVHGYSNIVAMLHRSLERHQAGHRTWTSRL